MKETIAREDESTGSARSGWREEVVCEANIKVPSVEEVKEAITEKTKAVKVPEVPDPDGVKRSL